MIENLQSGSREAATSMKGGREQAQKGVDYTEQAAEALAMISGNLTTINDMSMQIQHAAEEQTTVVEEVNRNVVTINDASMDGPESMRQVSAASDEVARLASGLHSLVEDYKV